MVTRNRLKNLPSSERNKEIMISGKGWNNSRSKPVLDFTRKLEVICKRARQSGIDIDTVLWFVRSHLGPAGRLHMEAAGTHLEHVRPQLKSSGSHLEPAGQTKLKTLLWHQKKTLHHIVIISLIVSLLLSPALRHWVRNSSCFLENNEILMETLRPASNCEELCQGMDSIPIEFNINRETFIEKYAYTGRPVLVKNATRNWTALKVFSFSFFQKLFSPRLEHLEECMFFPYNTNFTSLEQFLTMPEGRARFHPGQIPWYVGWSNCDPVISIELRKHYEKPFFLPKDSGTTAEDWIFMGGFGKGAHVHIDAVKRPSWQAMIAGKKTFILIVPPECEEFCKYTLNVTMETGDILILDTNQWYHSTYIHPEEVSIAIGSEYD